MASSCGPGDVGPAKCKILGLLIIRCNPIQHNLDLEPIGSSSGSFHGRTSDATSSKGTWRIHMADSRAYSVQSSPHAGEPCFTRPPYSHRLPKFRTFLCSRCWQYARLWAIATEFVSMCVCAGILHGEACDGDNVSREHIVDVDQDGQVRQMEQRTAQDEVYVVQFEGAHTCRR